MKTRKYIFIVLLTVLALVLINFLVAGSQDIWQNMKYYLYYSAGFTLLNTWYYYLIGKYLSWDKNPQKTLLISILGSIPVNALIYFGLRYLLNVLVFHKTFDSFLQQQRIGEYIVVVLFSLVVSLLIMIQYFFKTIQQEKMRAGALKIKNEQIKFESLKNQLDPHFLFNNLNVLTSLITENPQEAEDFALKLADIYRYVLEQKDRKLVPLQDELDFAAKYLGLLKVRYEEDLQYSLPDDVPAGAKIPPLSLQILLENAIKHNTISATNKLRIKIEIADAYLVVSNNKNRKNKTSGGFQIGLQNIRQRYALLSKLPVEITDNDKFFEVKIALLGEK